MNKKRPNILIFLIVFFITIFSSIASTQIQEKEIKASFNTLFNSSKVKSFILNTNAFEKRKSMDERVILLINWHLYNALKKEINQFIQDLFDEGIDVYPFLIDHRQFQSSSVTWRIDAGLWLKEFVFSAYYHSNMEKISDRTKKGLIILGTFPAAFLNWHQEKYRKSNPEWASLKAENDYKSCAVNLSWNPFKGPLITGYNIYTYICPDPDDPTTCVLIDKKQPKNINIQTNFQILLPLGEQKSFQFEIRAVFPDGTESNPAFSNIVNWNFLINPCDYVLADIDGFHTVVERILAYALNSSQNFGIKANPVLVVTKEVSDNEKRFELSSTDISRNYAQCEMYFGRIDASSLTGAWAAPDVSDSLVSDRNISRLTGVDRTLVSTDRNWSEEVRLIQAYLSRNHLWRKSKVIRDSYNRIFIFRSADFVGEPEDKTLLKNIWNNFSGIKQILFKDALQYSGGLNKQTPSINLYENPNYNYNNVGKLSIINKEINDLGNKTIGDNQASSLIVNLQGSNGAVILFSEKDYLDDQANNERVEVFRNNDNDLSDNWIRDNAVSSVQLWNSFEANSPEWDNKESLLRHLKAKWKLVDLGGHGSIYGFLLSKGVISNNRIRIWDERNVIQKDIWDLRGDIKFLINHNCHNGEFMAPGNAGTTFLFRNNMLALWGWAAVGTTEHEVLHQNLQNGDRFGVATMKNFDAQMEAENSNPWRSYFSAVLGDPTLRITYKQPDLYIKTMSVPKNMQSGKPFVINVTVENKGDREVDQPLISQVQWKIFAKNDSEEKAEGNFILRPIRAGESKTFIHTVQKNFLFGIYEIKFFIDPEDRVVEGDESNNKGQKEFSVWKNEEETPEKKSRIHLKVWGLLGKSEKPFFINGEPNTDSAHQEYTNWQEFETKDGYSFGGNTSFEFFLNKFFSLEIGAAYAERTAYVENLAWKGYSDETRMKTLSLPVLLKLNSGGKKINFFIGGGIESLFILEIKNHYHWESGGLVYDEIFGADAEKFGKSLVKLLDSPFSLALIGSAGIQLGHLTIEVRYFHGLKDILLEFKDTTFNGQVNAGKLKGILALLGLSF